MGGVFYLEGPQRDIFLSGIWFFGKCSKFNPRRDQVESVCNLVQVRSLMANLH